MKKRILVSLIMVGIISLVGCGNATKTDSANVYSDKVDVVVETESATTENEAIETELDEMTEEDSTIEEDSTSEETTTDEITEDVTEIKTISDAVYYFECDHDNETSEPESLIIKDYDTWVSFVTNSSLNDNSMFKDQYDVMVTESTFETKAVIVVAKTYDQSLYSYTYESAIVSTENTLDVTLLFVDYGITETVGNLTEEYMILTTDKSNVENVDIINIIDK